jgi:CheY-like chemotaxis protein
MNNAAKLPQKTPRILLVDDNHFGNVARKTVLEEQGYMVESALSGEEGLERCLQEHFDLVVTDLKMKQMSGVDLIAHLRQTAHPPRVILLSGWAVCLGLTEASSGADAVIGKSSQEQEQLVRVVRQLLTSAPARKSASSEKSAKKNANSSVARSG